MASKKIDELTNLTSLASDDLLIAYDISEPGGEKTKKISKTNAFNGLSVDGHTHDAYLPLTGGNLSGDLTVGGNLTVTGTQFIANVQTVEVTDNLMLLNKNETGAGVTAGTAGLEIERGTATNYKFLFDEPTDTFRVGMDGSLQAVATRADAPTNSGIAFWNDTLKRFDTSSLTPEDIGTGISYHGNEYHTVEFATVSGLTVVSGSLQDQLDNLSSDKIVSGGSELGFSYHVNIGEWLRFSLDGTPTFDLVYRDNAVILENLINSKSVSLIGRNSSGDRTAIFSGSADGASAMYHAGTAGSIVADWYGLNTTYGAASAAITFIGDAAVFRNNNANEIYLQGNNQTNIFYGNEAADLRLYYAGAEKLRTATDGISITGNITATIGMSINSLPVATQSYVDTVSGALNVAKANAIHTHDDRYYTESEVDTISGALNSAKLDLAGGNITGNLTVGGDFTVQGENFIANTQTVLVEDNLLVINKNEVGAGVTAGEAGIEVERGSEVNYKFLFDEAQDNFRVGVSGSLQAVATRQDAPTASGVAYWNASEYRFDTSAFTIQDVVTTTELSDVFSNKYEIFTTSGTTTFDTDFDLIEGAMGVYVDGVRQHASSFTFSSPRTITLSDTVASGTAIAVIAMEVDAVQAMSDKADKVSGGTTDNLAKLSSTGNLVDAGVSAASVIEVVNTFSRRNVIINGDFNIWQRGTSPTPVLGANYYADRWLLYTAGAAAAIITQGGGAGGSRQSISVIGAASNNTMTLLTRIESRDCAHFAGQVATLSAWVYSADSRAVNLYAQYANVADAFNALTTIGIYNSPAAANWRKITYTFTVPNVQTGLEIGIQFGACIAGTNVAATCVQLEIGSIATPFEFRPFAEELALCQRYYEKSYNLSTAPGTSTLNGECIYIAPITGTVYQNIIFRTSKRIPPAGTVTLYSVTGAINNVRDITTGTDVAASGVVESDNATVAQFAGTAGRLYGFHWTASAEL